MEANGKRDVTLTFSGLKPGALTHRKRAKQEQGDVVSPDSAGNVVVQVECPEKVPAVGILTKRAEGSLSTAVVPFCGLAGVVPFEAQRASRVK